MLIDNQMHISSHCWNIHAVTDINMLYQTNTMKVKESRTFEYCTFFFKDIRNKNKTRILNTSDTKVKTPPLHIKC